jgi:hypothetical protein
MLNHFILIRNSSDSTWIEFQSENDEAYVRIFFGFTYAPDHCVDIDKLDSTLDVLEKLQSQSDQSREIRRR